MPPLTIHANGRTFVVREARVEEIVPLRHRILRAGLPIEEAHFACDADPATRHAAAFEGGRAVGCATMALSPWEGEPAWQLRGMATDGDVQRCGIGRAVLQMAIDLATAANPLRTFWCNARVPAIPFYERQGWRVVSDEFFIPTAGPHRKMLKRA